MDYTLLPNLSPEDKIKAQDINLIDSIKITDGTLCYKNQTIGYVRCKDCKDKYYHGYGISVSNKHLYEQFNKDAIRQYPDFENGYIQFLDVLFRLTELELKEQLKKRIRRN